MHQIDFVVNITLAPGETYDFFLDGTVGTNIDAFCPCIQCGIERLRPRRREQLDA